MRGTGEGSSTSTTAPTNAYYREIRIGGSLGIALYPDHGDVPEALLVRADQAMYAAKADGRNRVRMG